MFSAQATEAARSCPASGEDLDELAGFVAADRWYPNVAKTLSEDTVRSGTA